VKTAISLPDDILSAAEKFARMKRISRDKLIKQAMVEYLKRHSADEITKAMNRAYGKNPQTIEPVIAKAQARAISREKW